MKDQDKTKKQLTADSTSPTELAEMRQRITELKAAQAEHKRTEEALKRRNRELTTLYKAATAISSNLSLDAVLLTVAKQMTQALDSSDCAVSLWNRERNLIETLVDHNVTWPEKTEPPGTLYDLDDYPATRHVLETAQPMLIQHDDPMADGAELAVMKEWGAFTLLMLPLVTPDRVVGLIELIDDVKPRNYTPDEIRLAESLAARAAVAIENARLYEQAQQEITERKQAEKELKFSDEGIRILFEFAPDAYYLSDLKGTFVDGNRAAEELVGYKKEELIGQSFLKLRLLPLNQIPRAAGLLAKNVLGRPTGPDEFVLNRKDGGQVPVEISTFPVKIEGRTLVLGIARDITERKRAGAELQRRNRELALLNRTSQIFSSTLDMDQVLITVLEEVRRLMNVTACSVWLIEAETGGLVCQQSTGLKSEVVRGCRLAPGEGIAGWVVHHGESLVVPDTRATELHFKGIDQQTGLELCSIVAIPLQIKQDVIGVLQVVDTEVDRFDATDLTLLEPLAASAAVAIENARLYKQSQQEIAERKQAEEALVAERTLLAQRVDERTAELSTANAELARASRLKDEFLASMSHELRTPLTAILGMSAVLRKEIYGSLGEKQLESVNTIEESGHHLLDLINDILDVSKIGAGKVELRIGPLSVESVCQASLQFIKREAHKKQLKISSTFDSAVTILQADERRLKQILVNLLSNAVKFTPQGGTVGLEVVGDAAGRAIHFTVWDTGIGIAPEDMTELFKPFIQLDSSLSRQYAGTGLGLTLVHRLTEMHGGGVSVESVVNEGSRFTVSLPWQPTELPTQTGTENENERSTVSSDRSSTNGSRQSGVILLAEDNQAVVDALSGYLSTEGYRCIVARDGAQAIERAREERPDVILMDIQMPVMDGLEATRCIRADADLAAVSIIALTALAMPGDRERCLAAGANAYLSKPIRLETLIEMIETQMEKAKGSK